MKNILLITSYIFTLIISIPANSQDYFYTNLYKAKQKAKEEDKRLFVDFSAVWCGPCKMMEKEVFPDIQVKKALTDKYICVKLLQGKNKSIFKSYNIKSFPTFIIMDYNGKEIFRWIGYGGKARFLERLEEVPMDNNIIDKYDSLYSSKKKDIDFLRKYYVVLNENKFHKKAKKISKKILEYDKNWLKKENMILVLNNIDTKKYYKFLLKNKAAFYDSISIDQVDNYLFNNYIEENYNSDIKSDYVDIEKIRKTFHKIFHPYNADKYIYSYFFYTLQDKTDPKLKQIYISSAIKFLQLGKNLMKDKYFYDIIENLIYKLNTKIQFKEIKKAFDFQFNDKPENIYMPYYDLKAFIEYMLNEKENYSNTIKTANEISLKSTGKHYETKLRQIIFAYNLLNKDITPETLK